MYKEQDYVTVEDLADVLDKNEEKIQTSLQNLCNQSRILRVFGWDQDVFLPLDDESVSKRYACANFYYKLEGKILFDQNIQVLLKDINLAVYQYYQAYSHIS